MLTTLADRMQRLFCTFLPYPAGRVNGVESVFQVLTDAMDLSGSSPLFEADVTVNANQYILHALEDAGRQWSTFWHSAHPGMEVPSIFLPKSSSCKVDLDNSMQSAQEFRFGANANPLFYGRLSSALAPKVTHDTVMLTTHSHSSVVADIMYTRLLSHALRILGA